MKVHNEIILAKEVPEVDIIVGGHDHIYNREVEEESGVLIVKSGTDFEVFSDIKCMLGVTEEANSKLVEEFNKKDDQL